MSTPSSSAHAEGAQRTTAPEDVVPLPTKLAFGASLVADNTIGNGAHQLVNPIYNIALGVNPAFLGMVLSAGRLLDAFTDPLIGNFSDNFRSRFGRRRPLIVAGAVLSGLAFWGMFSMPRGWSPNAYTVFFALAALLYFPSFALLSIPRAAMSIELTPDYHERTRVSAVGAMFGPIGGMIAVWLFALTKLNFFHDSIEGAHYVGFAVFALVAVLGSLPAFLVKERGYAETKRQPKIRFRESLSTAARNKPLLLLGASGMFIMIGLFTVFNLGLYLNIYYVNAGDAKTASVWHGATGSAYQITSILSAAPVSYLATRFGKRTTLIGAIIIALIGTVAKWFCFTPAAPWLMFVPMILMGMGMAGFWVLTIAMMADVCDYDELKSGFRREALLSSVNVWIYKTGMSLAYFMSGLVLLATGFQEKLGGLQSPETILGLRVLYSFVPAAALTIALFCVWKYPITEATAYATRQALEARRIKADSARSESVAPTL